MLAATIQTTHSTQIHRVLVHARAQVAHSTSAEQAAQEASGAPLLGAAAAALLHQPLAVAAAAGCGSHVGGEVRAVTGGVSHLRRRQHRCHRHQPQGPGLGYSHQHAPPG